MLQTNPLSPQTQLEASETGLCIPHSFHLKKEKDKHVCWIKLYKYNFVFLTIVIELVLSIFGLFLVLLWAGFFS